MVGAGVLGVVRRTFVSLRPWSLPASPVRCLSVKRFPVPAMGDSITEGSVVEIAKKPGDYVATEDVVMQIETDKVTIDVRATEAGILKSLMAAVGNTVIVGNDLYELDVSADVPAGDQSATDAGASGSDSAQQASAPSAPASPPVSSAPAAAPEQPQRIHPSGNPSLIRFGRHAPVLAGAESSDPDAALTPAGGGAPTVSSQPAPLWDKADEEMLQRYPRLPVSDKEGAAILLGGADHFLN